MVAGDLVNTASRVQSAAEPGIGLRRRLHAARDRADDRLRGRRLLRAQGQGSLTPLWKAQRVVSGLRGSLKSHGLEAPFVGRDRELRQIKDLFHVSAEERKAHLISMTGIAGIGKSRLGWEFYKYFDGIATTVYWHRGRCLSYGEGVTYWALADMVRMRCRIAEDEDPERAPSCAPRSRSIILDPEERGFLEPRLAHLLGARRAPGPRPSRISSPPGASSSSASPRLPDRARLRGHAVGRREPARLRRVPARLVAEPSILVVTLARPGAARAPADLGRRPTELHVALPRAAVRDEAMEELLDGPRARAPGRGAQDEILARAEGVPLYAVETVRMLLDRGCSSRMGRRTG